MSGIIGQSTNLKMAFEVEEVHNIILRKRVAHKEGKGLRFEDTETKLDTAYMVYMPAGHSILVETEAELIRLGFRAAPPVVDMETGEAVPITDTLSPKEIVKRSTQIRRAV